MFLIGIVAYWKILYQQHTVAKSITIQDSHILIKILYWYITMHKKTYI